MWHRPVIAICGILGATMFPTSSGVFMRVVTTEFGWSHVQFASAFTFQVLLGLITIPIAGRLADRFGSRRVILSGMIPFALTFSLLGLANGSVYLWWATAMMNAFFVACICPPIWIKPVATGFHVSRGLALAVALAGIGLAGAVWPVVGAFCIDAFGWRLAYPAMAALWAVPMFIVTLFFFDRQDRLAPEAETASTVIGYREAVLSRTFICLAMAGGLFSCITYGFIVHLVPMLQHKGLDLKTAAGIAGLMGVMSIFGRIFIGLLLDKLPTHALGIVIFLLPIAASLILQNQGASVVAAMVASAIFGFAAGAETDIMAYLAAKRFPRSLFTSVYALATAVFAFSASLGPLVAGSSFDATQSYELYLALIIPFVVAGAALIWLIPQQTDADQQRAPATI